METSITSHGCMERVFIRIDENITRQRVKEYRISHMILKKWLVYVFRIHSLAIYNYLILKLPKTYILIYYSVLVLIDHS